MPTIEEQAIEKLREDPNFQAALKKFEEMDVKSQEYAEKLSNDIVDLLGLNKQELTIDEARDNLLVARMTAAKVLATLSSFNYEEEEFINAITKARKCVTDELVPMLANAQPCGQCENCKNGHPDQCLNPQVRLDYTESRFLPLLSESLIEYDAWNEILYRAIPADETDADVLKDINPEFQIKTNPPVKKKHGRPKKNKEEDNNVESTSEQ